MILNNREVLERNRGYHILTPVSCIFLFFVACNCWLHRAFRKGSFAPKMMVKIVMPMSIVVLGGNWSISFSSKESSIH